MKTGSLNLRRRIKDWWVSLKLFYIVRGRCGTEEQAYDFNEKFGWSFQGTLGLGAFALQNSERSEQTFSVHLDLESCRNKILCQTGAGWGIFPAQLNRLLDAFQTIGFWNNASHSFSDVKITLAQRRTEFWLTPAFVFQRRLLSCI